MVHLNVHSNHSLLRGTARPRQLVARAVEHGMGALALTDSGGLYGAIPFYQAARAAGVKPIIGVQLGEAVVLARDREGYAQLCEVVTACRLGKVAVSGVAAWLAGWPFPFGDEHLFLLTGERGLVRAWHDKGLVPLVAMTHYGDRASGARAAGQYAFAEELGLRAVAVNPVYFLDGSHYGYHRVLSAIRENTTVDMLDEGMLADRRDWFRSPREMEQLYAAWPSALENMEGVAEACNLELSFGTPLFPTFTMRRGGISSLGEAGDDSDAHPKEETAFSWLWKETFAGAKERYRPLTPAVIDRIHYELDIIHQLGFAPYFLIVGDIVRFAREQGIAVMGRGSAANSVVAYALGITRVDPLKYNLYFERFLNLSRTDSPDIDLDICWRRRDEVIAYVYATYGAERVAMICTFNTFRARSAVREVAKAYGFTEQEIGAVTRLLPHYHARDLRRMTASIPECRGLRFDEEPLKSILATSEFIDGFPRHLSIHSGGVLIAPDRLTRYVPLERSAKGIVITQYDMHPIADLGLIKMDLLGHRSLTVIDETVKAIKENRGVALDIEAVPDHDPLTAALLRSGKTIACFQIESPAMRGLLQKVGANDVHTLIQCIALVRPGASGSGMKQHFIDRHHGREETVYLHPTLETVLGDTYGVMIYQEDVLKVAHAVAGMDLAEGDALRRAMSKKRSPREMAKSMRGFIAKACARGVEEEAAEKIWELIANFAAYSYCKAHAASYGEIAYQCAYLKAHYPVEFFAAVLSNRGGFYSPPVYLEEAKRCGIEVRPPDIHRSEAGYRAEGDALRVGLIEIGQLSRRSVERIVAVRNEAPFEDLADFLRRVALPYAEVELLFRAGALCGVIGRRTLSRPSQFWQVRQFYQTRRTHEKSAGRQRLLEGNSPPSPPHFPEYSARKCSELEWETLGLMTQHHPLHYYLPRLQGEQFIASVDLPSYAGQTVTLLGWLMAERRLAVKDGGGVMKFLTLEDTRGTYEAVLFPGAYRTYGHLLTTHGPYLLTGRAQNDSNAYVLMVEEVVVVGRSGGPRTASLAGRRTWDGH